MQTTYHIKAKEVNDAFISNIRKLFRDEEDITITIAAEKNENTGQALIQKLTNLEKKYPPRQIDKGFDFNAAVDAGITL